MSSLTEQERIGLEEVFLSISTKNKDLGKLRHLKRKLHTAWSKAFLKDAFKKPSRVLFEGRKRIKFPNFHHLLPKKNKKKKNLS